MKTLFSFLILLSSLNFAFGATPTLHCQNRNPNAEVQTVDVYPKGKNFETVTKYKTYDVWTRDTNVKELELEEINLATPYGEDVGMYQIKKIIDTWFVVETTLSNQTLMTLIDCH